MQQETTTASLLRLEQQRQFRLLSASYGNGSVLISQLHRSRPTWEFYKRQPLFIFYLSLSLFLYCTIFSWDKSVLNTYMLKQIKSTYLFNLSILFSPHLWIWWLELAAETILYQFAFIKAFKQFCIGAVSLAPIQDHCQFLWASMWSRGVKQTQ